MQARHVCLFVSVEKFSCENPDFDADLFYSTFTQNIYQAEEFAQISKVVVTICYYFLINNLCVDKFLGASPGSGGQMHARGKGALPQSSACRLPRCFRHFGSAHQGISSQSFRQRLLYYVCEERKCVMAELANKKVRHSVER